MRRQLQDQAHGPARCVAFVRSDPGNASGYGAVRRASGAADGVGRLQPPRPSNSCTVRVAPMLRVKPAIRVRVSLDANLERLLENSWRHHRHRRGGSRRGLLRTRRATQTQRLQAAAIGLVAAGAVAAVAMYGLKAMRDSSEDISAVDSAMASAHALADGRRGARRRAGRADRLREALREEIRQPTTQVRRGRSSS